MDGITAYALSKKVAASAVSGVQSMSVSGQTLTINTKDSGVLTMTFPTPKDGISVTDIDVNANNQIVFTMSDGSEIISGKIPTVKGETGDTGKSAYELAKDNGFTGTEAEWLDSLKGDAFTYDDFTEEQLENLKGQPGYTPQKDIDYFDGVSPTATVEKVGKVATITITDKNGTTTATIKDGEGSEGGEANIIDSISVNGVNVAVDENKNVDITVPSIEGLTKDEDLATVAKSGDYEDLINKPTIPSLDGYAKTSEIPSKVSELENDSNYLSSIPEEYVTETELEAKGYLTEHQDISGKVDKVEGRSLISDTEITRLATVDNYDDTDIKAEIAKKADATAIPSKVSELTNDSNYQTAEQVNSTVTTEIAKVVADAPEDLNTLKEMSDWIAGHEDDASAMNSAISDNKTAITALQTGKADKTEIPTFTNKTVLDGITSEKVADWDEAVTAKTALEAHTNSIVSSKTGVHGMRYFNDTLQVQNDDNEWIDIETGGSGGGGIAPNNVSDINLKTGNRKLTIAWSDPSDTIIEGQTLCTWKGTKLVQKVGSFPENPKDGTLLLDNQTRDKYKTSGFEITGLTNGETYYFALFPYSDTGATNLNTANRISGTTQSYRTMTAVIDLTNSNPLSSVTYADDAAGMTKGSEDWDEFLGYYPVLLDASGNELGKLNPNNYAQYEDGTSAPINTLGSYDVMVAFPKRGLKISTANNKVTISMTDDPDNEDFKYYAHSYGAHNNCDVVYVGAYKASADGTKLYSCSGQSPLVSQTIGTFRTYAHNRGEGYEQMTFYVRTFLCCAYILRFGNLNSQAAVGQGYVKASERTNTGATNAQGMNYGTTSQTTQIKCLGIEDLWGNVQEWVDGIYSSSTRNILTAIYNKNMNDTGSGYQDNGQGASSDIGSYMSKPQGTTETGFVAKEVSGSATTYFCDYANLSASSVAYGGGSYGSADNAGVFRLYIDFSVSDFRANFGGRLIKFKVAA